MHHTRVHLALVVMLVAGCAGIESDEELGETASDLSVTGWSAKVALGSSDLGSTPATVNGTTVIVRSEGCDPNGGEKDLAWAKRIGAGNWTAWVVIPGQTSRLRPSLAAFN